jgi:hypothetical protein
LASYPSIETPDPDDDCREPDDRMMTNDERPEPDDRMMTNDERPNMRKTTQAMVTLGVVSIRTN